MDQPNPHMEQYKSLRDEALKLVEELSRGMLKKKERRCSP